MNSKAKAIRNPVVAANGYSVQRGSKVEPVRPTKVLQHQWGAIRNRSTFEIPKAILQHMNRFKDDGSTFLYDTQAFGINMRTDSDDWRVALGVRWQYMNDLDDRRKGLDAARRLSYMLFIRDQVRLIDPRASTRRPTQETRDALVQVLGQICTTSGSMKYDTMKKLWTRFKYGEKVHHLNREFGDGAMLVLACQLSNDFLKEKSPPSDFRKEAYTHLRSNESFMIAAARTKALGENIREVWIRPLREGYKRDGISVSRVDDDTDFEETDLEDYDDKGARRLEKETMRNLWQDLNARAADCERTSGAEAGLEDDSETENEEDLVENEHGRFGSGLGDSNIDDGNAATAEQSSRAEWKSAGTSSALRKRTACGELLGGRGEVVTKADEAEYADCARTSRASKRLRRLRAWPEA